MQICREDVEILMWMCYEGLSGSHPDHSTKCDTIVSHFRIVPLSILSVPTLCLKDPQTKNDTIYPEIILTVGVTHWNKVIWVLNSPSTINYYLLFDMKEEAKERERERERETETETERDTERERERRRERRIF